MATIRHPILREKREAIDFISPDLEGAYRGHENAGRAVTVAIKAAWTAHLSEAIARADDFLAAVTAERDRLLAERTRVTALLAQPEPSPLTAGGQPGGRVIAQPPTPGHVGPWVYPDF